MLASGSGRLGFFTSGRSLNLVGTTINGRRITFVANRQGDGSWLIDRVGDSDSQEDPPDDQTAPRLSGTIPPRTYTVGTAIRPLILPPATGGDGARRLTLTPPVPGLTFDARTRRLTGTPARAGTYRMTYRVTDSDTNTGARDTDTRTFTITVQARGDFAPYFSATIAPRTYTVGTAISARTLPAATGGNGARTYRLTPAVPGLAFNARTRRLSGTPTRAGTYA